MVRCYYESTYDYLSCMLTFLISTGFFATTKAQRRTRPKPSRRIRSSKFSLYNSSSYTNITHPSADNSTIFGIRHFPFFNLTENLAKTFASDFQILASDFRYWELSTISQNSDGEIRDSDGDSSARFSVSSKKGRCLFEAPCLALRARCCSVRSY